MAGLEEKTNAQVKELSGGQKQRLYFALAVCGDPEVLFLDEPTVGMDVEGRRSFIERIAEFAHMGRTVVLTTHYLEEADQLAKRVIVIDRGLVIADASPQEIKSKVAGKRVRFTAEALTEQGSRWPTHHHLHDQRPQRAAPDEPAGGCPSRAVSTGCRDLRPRSVRRRSRGCIHLTYYSPSERVMAVMAVRRAPIGPMLARQTWAEFLKLWRVPAFSITSLFLPVMFYAFIGIGQSSQVISPHVTFGAYFLASMAVYAVANVMIFSFGISVATERGMKMDLLMRATPLPPLVYLLSKCITALVFAALTLVVLFPFAYLAGGVRLDPSVWVTLASQRCCWARFRSSRSDSPSVTCPDPTPPWL